MKSDRAGGKAALVLAALLLVACGSGVPADPVVRQDFIMDTSIALTVFSDQGDAVANRIFERLRTIDGHVRVQNQTSELAVVNQLAGVKPVAVSPDTYAIASLAVELAQLSGGAFDPTIGPVSLLWNIESDAPHVPSPAELKLALPLINWQEIDLDPTRQSVGLRRPGMQLDFGGVAKGYAALEAARICREAGVKSALLNMGDSSIYALGTKPNGKPWRIGIQNPDPGTGGEVQRGQLLGVVECADAVVESSGSYERFFVKDGRQYHHIMDPKTGFPVNNGLVQVTLILGGDTRWADGLSTAVFVLGPVAGLRLVESLPNAAAIMVGSDHSVRLSSRAKGRFHLDDASFHLVDEPVTAAAEASVR